MGNKNSLERDILNHIRKTHHQMPRWLILLIMTGIFTLLAFHASGMLIILLVSCIVAYLLSSVINKFESLGFKRNVVVMALFIFLAFLFSGAEMLLSPYLQREIVNFYDNLPAISEKVENVITRVTAENVKNYPLLEEFIGKMLNEVMSPGHLINKTLNFTEIFSHAASFLLALVLIPFFVFFLLKDWPRILKKIMGWIPAVYVETTVSVISEINILAGNYLRGVTIDCISVGIIASLGLWICGINYPISLGILTGAANVIPYLGPIMACIAASLIAFIQFNTIGAVMNIVLVYITIKLIDDLVIQPLTIGKSVSLHPMLLIITIFIGEELFGVIGMILAVPIVTTAQKIASIMIENHRQTAFKNAQILARERAASDYSGNVPL
jgi:predicted PurR-regulated permease PerM